MAGGRWGVLAVCTVLAGGGVLPQSVGLADAATTAKASALPVTIGAFTGMPADSAIRREFLDGFQAAFDAGELPTEKLAGGQWTSAGERQSVFRLVDAAAPDETWSLALSIGVPPTVRVPQRRRKASEPQRRPRVSEVRTSRGLTIAVAALSPAAAWAGEPVTPTRFAVYFPDARRIVVPSYRLPSGGYDYPWADAGRVVARAALEALHRANDMLAADERADLAPAQRAEETP
jgi:hypothetical protein